MEELCNVMHLVYLSAEAATAREEVGGDILNTTVRRLVRK
jgi:hypothetical protein